MEVSISRVDNRTRLDHPRICNSQFIRAARMKVVLSGNDLSERNMYAVAGR